MHESSRKSIVVPIIMHIYAVVGNCGVGKLVLQSHQYFFEMKRLVSSATTTLRSLYVAVI